jgi:YihY family inner membrane protein
VTDTTSSGAAEQAKQKLDRVDAFQQQHKPVAIPIAVVKKFSEDQSTNLASMIAFWAFFSIFPLLLVLVTLLGFFLPSGTRDSVLTQVAQFFPLLDPTSISGLTGSWWALIVGIVTALWSGSAVVRTVQFAFNSVWEIPYHQRPKFVEKLLRSLLVLSTIGVGLVLSVLITGFVSGASHTLHLAWFGHLLGYVIAIALDVVLFIAAFRMLTDRDISTKDVLPGAVLSGVAFWILQSLSSLIISHYLSNAQSTYGKFATVITMLWWFYITSIVTLMGAQLNVVLKERLYPRGLVKPQTEADHRFYDNVAKERTYHEEQRVETRFEGAEQKR